jgi:UDP-glucose 4-epimerase
MGVFNALEAAVRFGVGRFVNLSSETVPGFFSTRDQLDPESGTVVPEPAERLSSGTTAVQRDGRRSAEAQLRRAARPSARRVPGGIRRATGRSTRLSADGGGPTVGVVTGGSPVSFSTSQNRRGL